MVPSIFWLALSPQNGQKKISCIDQTSPSEKKEDKIWCQNKDKRGDVKKLINSKK